MFKDLIEKLRCPECHLDLRIHEADMMNDEIITGVLECSKGHQWKIHEGVLDFNSSEQELGNAWTKAYEEYDYKELDEHIMAMQPQTQLDAYDAAFRYFEEAFDTVDGEWVVDIATGRGMLLMELAKRLGNKINLVCTDLSHLVLKYDRLKCMEIDPEIRINYIACDATNLPLKDDSMNQAVSFFGISNMSDIADLGIKESLRVAQTKLCNAGLIVKDDNPKVPDINKMLAEAGYDVTLDSALKSNFEKMHQYKQFETSFNSVYEGISEKLESDLIPIENEWFSLTVAIVEKN